MDTLDDRNVLMKKLAISRLGCRNMLNLVFESCFYCMYQKRLEEIIFYFKIVKPNIALRKLK